MSPIHASKVLVTMSKNLVILALILAFVLYHDKLRIEIAGDSSVVTFKV